MISIPSGSHPFMERGFPVKSIGLRVCPFWRPQEPFCSSSCPGPVDGRKNNIPAVANAAAGIRRLMGAGTRPAGSAYRNSAKKRSQKPGAFTVSGGGSGSFGRFIGSVAIANCT